MEIESISNIKLADYCKYYNFTIRKIGWRKWLYPVAIAFLLIVSLAVLVMALYEYNSAITLFIIMIALCGFLIIYSRFIIPRISYKGSKEIYSYDNYFFWHDDYFTVKINSNEITSTSDYKYTSLIKVCDVNDYLYLYISKSQAHLIPKNSFTKGSWVELSDILKNNLGNKYKTYR